MMNETKVLADVYEQSARDRRIAKITLLTEASKARIEIIKDYTILLTARVGIIVTLIGTNSSIVKSPFILWVALIISVASIAATIFSRQYYIDEIDEYLSLIEKNFIKITYAVYDLRLASTDVDIENAKKKLMSIEEEKPNHLRPRYFFDKDIRNEGYLIFIIFILIILSLLIKFNYN